MKHGQQKTWGKVDCPRYDGCRFAFLLFCREVEIRAGLVRWFLMAYGSAWEMKEQGAIGKTGHQWGYFSLSEIWDRKWAPEKMVYRGHGICEKYPFDLFLPARFPPNFRHSPARCTKHQHSLPGGHEEQDDEEYEKDEALGRFAHMGWMIAMGADGLVLANSRRSFRLAWRGLCLKSCCLHHPNPTRSRPPLDDNRLDKSRMEGFCYLCCTC